MGKNSVVSQHLLTGIIGQWVGTGDGGWQKIIQKLLTGIGGETGVELRETENTSDNAGLVNK